MQRREQKGSHQPPPAWIITAAEPALESKHLKPKKCKAPTHRDSVHNERGITNTVTYKPFTRKHTSMSGYNVCGHEQIHVGTLFHRNMRSQPCTGDHSPPPPPPLPEKKGSGSALLSQAKTCAVLAQVGVSPTVNPTHDRGEHHMPRPNRRLSQTAGTAKRNSLPENLPRPANTPQPKLPLAQCSPNNLEGTPR